MCNVIKINDHGDGFIPSQPHFEPLKTLMHAFEDRRSKINTGKNSVENPLGNPQFLRTDAVAYPATGGLYIELRKRGIEYIKKTLSRVCTHPCF